MSTQPILERMEDVEKRAVDRSPGAAIQVLLGPEHGMRSFYTRRFTLEPGARIPLHRHDTIEHQQVVLDGEMILTLDGRDHAVRAGGVVFIPPGVAHAYENRGSARVRFLCMVPATTDYATEWLDDPPDEG